MPASEVISPQMPHAQRQREKQRAGLSDDSEDYDDGSEDKPLRSRRRAGISTGIGDRGGSRSRTRAPPALSVSFAQSHILKGKYTHSLGLNRMPMSKWKPRPLSYPKLWQVVVAETVHPSVAVGHDFLSTNPTKAHRAWFPLSLPLFCASS